MKHTLLIPLFFILLALSVIAQQPDSLIIIPMNGSKPDTNQYQLRPSGSNARLRNPDSFWRRVSVGGNLGFQFGTITGFNISPEVRIRTVDQLYVGLGFIYQYFRVSNYFVDTTNWEYISYTSNTFGGRIYLRYYLASLLDNWVGNFFVHAEYEYLHYIIPFEYDPAGKYIDRYSGLPYSKGREVLQIHSVFLGGGYRQPISNRAFFDFLILFNLNDSPYSPYTNPVFRLGVGVGL